MDFYEASTKLAELIDSGEFYDPGMAIQFFAQALMDGETPAMSLDLVKKAFDENESAESIATALIKGY